jgi:hypothetical protein
MWLVGANAFFKISSPHRGVARRNQRTCQALGLVRAAKPFGMHSATLLSHRLAGHIPGIPKDFCFSPGRSEAFAPPADGPSRWAAGPRFGSSGPHPPPKPILNRTSHLAQNTRSIVTAVSDKCMSRPAPGNWKRTQRRVSAWTLSKIWRWPAKRVIHNERGRIAVLVTSH